MITARERLLALPDWFTHRSASMLLDIPADAMQVYLFRWKRSGLVDSFGARTGVYFNRVRCPEGADHCRIPALLHLFPEATLIGDSVLHAHGWITQIPSAVQVAILPKDSTVHPEGFAIEQRSKGWFRALREQLVPAEEGASGLGLRELSAAAALADMQARGVRMDPDDLYVDPAELDEVEEIEGRLRGMVRLPGRKRAPSLGF